MFKAWFQGNKEEIPLFTSSWISCKDCFSDPAVNKAHMRECEQFLFNFKVKGIVDNAFEAKPDFRFPYSFVSECFKGSAVVLGKTVRYSSYPKPLEALVKRIVTDKQLPTSERELKVKINEWADFFSTCLEMYFTAKAEGGRPFGTKEVRERERSPTNDLKRARVDVEN